MQFYWRIIEELKYLGEALVFHDPGLVRQYKWWTRKDYLGLAFSEMDYRAKAKQPFTCMGISPCLN